YDIHAFRKRRDLSKIFVCSDGLCRSHVKCRAGRIPIDVDTKAELRRSNSQHASELPGTQNADCRAWWQRARHGAAPKISKLISISFIALRIGLFMCLRHLAHGFRLGLAPRRDTLGKLWIVERQYLGC